MRIFGETYDVRAAVESIVGYSAHADQRELLAWAEPLDRARLQHLFLVHGEPQASDTLAQSLRSAGFGNVTAPARGVSVEF